MRQRTKPITEHHAWKELVAHHQKIRELHLRALFANDPKRGYRF
jgi:glucose-6-phosphate isomerase